MISYNSCDLPYDVCVPVIASFSKDGHIAPLYVRIKEHVLKVDSFWVRTDFLNIMEFNCKLVDDKALKPLVLVYHKSEDIWTVAKHYLRE